MLALTTVYFAFLYFGIGGLFLLSCRYFRKKGILELIEKQSIQRSQIIFEIGHSVKSIIIFGFSVLPVAYLIRSGVIQLAPDTITNILLGVILLTLWNEIYFYLIHRLMHQKFMMKQVHYIHHKSTVPTVYSVYSFHFLEATLLSCVPLTLAPLISLSFTAIFLYPLASILLNFSGHCNYRFGSGSGPNWFRFGTDHNHHHSKRKKNYGFAINILDKLFS